MQRLDAHRDGLAASVVSIGVFDGVHRGHGMLLRHLRDVGERLGLPSCVVTFDRHPLSLVAPEREPLKLASLDDRLMRLSATGSVDHCLVLPFDEAMRSMSAEDFCDRFLVRRLGVHQVVVGADFTCGRGREGTVGRLAEIGSTRGFSIEGIGLLRPGGQVVSSTRIRGSLAKGEVEEAAKLLGVAHTLHGCVVNSSADRVDISLPGGYAAPSPGRYAGRLTVEGGESRRVGISLAANDPVLAICRGIGRAPFLPGRRVRVTFDRRLPLETESHWQAFDIGSTRSCLSWA